MGVAAAQNPQVGAINDGTVRGQALPDEVEVAQARDCLAGIDCLLLIA